MLTCQVDLVIHYKYSDVCSGEACNGSWEDDNDSTTQWTLLAAVDDTCGHAMPIHTGLGVSFQTGDALVGRVRGIQDLRAQGVRGHDPGTIHQCFTNTGQIVAHIPEGNYRLWGGKLADICGYREVLSWRVGIGIGWGGGGGGGGGGGVCSEWVASLTLSLKMALKGFMSSMNEWVWHYRSMDWCLQVTSIFSQDHRVVGKTCQVPCWLPLAHVWWSSGRAVFSFRRSRWEFEISLSDQSPNSITSGTWSTATIRLGHPITYRQQGPSPWSGIARFIWQCEAAPCQHEALVRFGFWCLLGPQWCNHSSALGSWWE